MSDQKSKIAFEGKIIRVVQKESPSGKIFEIATRPPGTRILIHDLKNDQILLSSEIRLDIGLDLRLPGGKVRDTNQEWDQIKDDKDLNKIIIEAAAKEVREEAGLEVKDLKIFTISPSGGPTIKWDMYYLVSNKFTDLGHQSLEEDEKIVTKWYPVPEVIKLCLSGQIKEGRTVAAILQYLYSIGKTSL